MFSLKGFALISCLVLAVGNCSKLKDLFQSRHFETDNDRINEDDAGEFWSKFERSKEYEMDENEPTCVPDTITQCTDNDDCNPMCSNFAPGICALSKSPPVCIADSGLGVPALDASVALKRTLTNTKKKKQRV